MKCIVCATATQAGLFPWHATCPSCHYELADFAVTINQPQAHELVNEDDREAALKHLRADNFTTILGHIGRLASPTARTLLDVGSAHGWFLDQARAHFDVLGIEPDTAVGEKAVARGQKVRMGYFPNALRDGERFDIIVFNDVIEHIPDIQSALQACRARLHEGGLLVLNLPSSRGFFYRLSKLLAVCRVSGPFERMWQKGLPSPHVHYFNERNLNTLVSRHGFTQIATFELAALRLKGLKQRLRFVGKVNPLVVHAQYLALAAAVPVLALWPSDILVSVFRKPALTPGS